MFIGIDIGTRNLKVGLYGEDLQQVRLIAAPTPWLVRQGVKTLDPGDLLRSVVSQIDQLVGDGTTSIVGVGIASMAEVGFIETGGSGLPKPATGWFEDRGGESAALLLKAFGDEFTVMTGRAPSPVCTVVKLHDMGAVERLPRRSRFHSVAEWVAHRLGGDPVAEASLASRTGLMNVRTEVPCEDVLSWCGLDPDFLPEVRRASEGVGEIRSVHPRVDGAALAVAGHDHLAAMVGVGATDISEVLDSCGTAEAIVMNADDGFLSHALDLARAGGSVSRHVLEDRCAAFAPSFRSGAVLQRVLDELGVDVHDANALAELDERSRILVRRAGGQEIPGLLSEPIQWPVGLEGAPAARRWAAAIDSIGATGVRRLRVLEEVLGPAERVHITGGWAHGPAVRAVKQTMSEQVEFAPVLEAGARGAAVVAAVVAGHCPSILESGNTFPASEGRQP